jgi:hypothetical protein
MAAPNVEELERQFNTAMEEAETGTPLDAIRRLYGELERDDPDAIGAIVHTNLEVQTHATFLDGKSYKGVRGFLNWRKDLGNVFEEHRFQPVGVRFAGRDRWVVLGRMHVKEADGGAELDLPLAQVCEQKDRKLARITVYSSISDALESVGLFI